MKHPNRKESQPSKPKVTPYVASSNYSSSHDIADILLKTENNEYRVMNSTSIFELMGISKEELAKFLVEAERSYKEGMQQIEETYEEQYEKLKESRKYVPPLAVILRNMQLSDTVRSIEAAFIVMKSFIDIEGVRNVYMSNQRVEDRKKLIVEIHNISVANNLKPFDLAKKENMHFVKEGIEKIKSFFDITISEARAIYERLADHGYLGTLEEIEEIKRNIKDFGWETAGAVTAATHLTLTILALNKIQEIGRNSNIINDNSSLIISTALVVNLLILWAFIVSQLKDNKGMENIFDRYKHLLSVPVRVPKYYILRSKLKKLGKHAELVKVTQQLLQTTNDVDYKFENLDAISNEDLKILISRLTNIALVLPREFKGGKKATVQELQSLSDVQLEDLVASIREYDLQQVSEQIDKTVEIMAKGSLEPDQIEKIKAQLHHEVAENHRLPLPTDMVEVEVDKYQYIKYLDDYVETLNPSDRIRNKYERLKAEALVGNGKLEKLRECVMLMTKKEPDSLNDLEVRAEVKPFLDELPLTDDQRDNITDMLHGFASDIDVSKTHNTGYNEIPLDLDELKELVAQRKEIEIKQPRE